MKRARRPAEPHLVYGINVADMLFERAPERIIEVLIQEDLGGGRRQRLEARLAGSGAPIRTMPGARLEALAGSPQHQGIVVRVHPPAPLGETEALALIEDSDCPLLLLLDGIQDPRNFGACLRAANAAGADLVVTARSRNVGLTPTVSKTASGAAEIQPLAQVPNLARFMASLGRLGVWLVGTDGAAEQSLYAADLTQPTGLVLGAEGQGLRRLTRERCDLVVSLPMRGGVESLNASVAAGICLYEAVRQRHAMT